MLGELQAKMTEAGWDHVDEAVAEWRSQYAGRQIIAGFMKDKDLGKKRLMSMPDRTTNTINLASGQTATRPTAINCYGAEFASMEQWWAQWKGFMFDTKLSLASGKEATPSQLVGKISRAKYPALTEAEEAMSRPLSAICQAASISLLPPSISLYLALAPSPSYLPLPPLPPSISLSLPLSPSPSLSLRRLLTASWSTCSTRSAEGRTRRPGSRCGGRCASRSTRARRTARSPS